MNFIKSFTFEGLKGILGSPDKNNHPRFHGHCKTVNRPVPYEIPLPDGETIRLANNNYCLKHKVYCGPSFWEWGWFDGERSGDINPKNGPAPKAVLQKDLSGEVIKKWSSVQEVVETGKFLSSGISESANGRKLAYKGYVWEYAR